MLLCGCTSLSDIGRALLDPEIRVQTSDVLARLRPGSRGDVTGLEIVKGAALPAGEPFPVGADVVSRAVIEAGPEQELAAARDFGAGGVILFFPDSAWPVRLLVRFFHTC